MAENKGKYFLDTNIPMYAAGKESKYKKACLNILKSIKDYNFSYYLNTEILQEILYRYSSVGLEGFGIKLARKMLELIPNILPVTKEDIYLSMSFMETYDSLLSRDAIIAANMVNNKIRHMITVGNDFSRMKEIRTISPLEFLG